MYLFHVLLAKNKFFQLNWAVESQHLSNDILCAHHVFLSYSNLGYLIMMWYYILYFYKALHNIYIYIFFQKTIYATRWSWSPRFFQSVQKARLIKHTHTHTQTHTHTHKYTNTQTHKHAQTHKHTHTNTHKHTINFSTDEWSILH